MAHWDRECSGEGSESGQSHPDPREWDEDGVPRRLPVGGWVDLGGPVDREGVPGREAEGWLRAVLRFSRPDGSPVFGPRGRSTDRLGRLAEWAGRIGDPGSATILHWWKPGLAVGVPGVPCPPPLPADSRADRPLAILRPSWSEKGEFVAVDHREPGGSSLVEVFARGWTWLGPTWASPPGSGRVGGASPTFWSTGAFADCLEWSFRVGRGRVTRTAVLLRGRQMALLAQQDDGIEGVGEVRLALPEGIEATPDPALRTLVLSAGRGRPSVRLIPIGLPSSPYPTDRGSLAVEGREVVLRHAGEGRRRWLPLLISWGKSPTHWRTLTVAGRSQACRSGEAFAARVAWGPADEGLVVYRSLTPPTLRNFLGHQTQARFLIGGFTASGDVRPILKVEK